MNFVVIAVGVFGLGEIISNLEDEADRSVMTTKVTGLSPSNTARQRGAHSGQELQFCLKRGVKRPDRPTVIVIDTDPTHGPGRSRWWPLVGRHRPGSRSHRNAGRRAFAVQKAASAAEPRQLTIFIQPNRRVVAG